MYTGYGSTSPPLTNNPFLPQTGQSASSRFPDISTSPIPSNNGAVWPNGSMVSEGGFPYQQQTSLHQQLPMQNGYGAIGYGSSGVPSGYTSPTASSFPPSLPFQTQSYANTFGQQQQQFAASSAPHVSGSSYSYLTGRHPQQPNQSYTPAQQQLHNNPGYIAQFDPYSAIGQGWEGGGWASNNNINNNKTSRNLDPNFGVQVAASASTGSTLSTASSTSSTLSGGSFGVGPKGDSHPKDYIRAHKTEIEGWETHAWKQLLNAFEAMKNAWEARKDELMVRAKTVISLSQTDGGYYAQQIQQEATRLQQLIREAESNFDSVAASLFQMQEVFLGYRQSGDAASKRRVREATNAALHALPGWPQPL